MAGNGETESAKALLKIDKKVLWLGVSVLVGLILWFMPTPAGLAVPGKHALAVVNFTVLLWITKAVPTSVGSLLMIGIVICLMPKEVEPGKFLFFWTQDTMWFVLVCFIFGGIIQKSGLGNRLATNVFSIRSLLLIDIALFGLNALFSIVGMAASFPKLTLLLPLVTSVALLSGIDKEDPYVRHVALMINVLANQTGLLVYTGFSLNPALGSLGGFQVNYTTWLQWFFVPALVLNIISFFVLYFLFLPPRTEKGFDPKIMQEKRSELGPMKKDELKAIAWLVFAVVLWATGGVTGISTGFAATLVAALLMLPGIGMISFKEFVQYTDWNTIFMLMGVLAIGSLGVRTYKFFFRDQFKCFILFSSSSFLRILPSSKSVMRHPYIIPLLSRISSLFCSSRDIIVLKNTERSIMPSVIGLLAAMMFKYPILLLLIMIFVCTEEDILLNQAQTKLGFRFC